MEEVKEALEETEEKDNQIKTNKENEKMKKTWEINGISIWRILAYFALYSFLGFVIETTYGLLTKGRLESRQSFLYGPFCAIYGVGAVIMIVALHKIKKEKRLEIIFRWIYSRFCYRIFC